MLKPFSRLFIVVLRQIQSVVADTNKFENSVCRFMFNGFKLEL